MAEKKQLLTFICFHHKTKHGATYNVYQCECGNRVVRREWNVTAGRTRSCGCLRYHEDVKKLTSENKIKGLRKGHLMGKLNKHNTSGITGVSYNKQTKHWVASLNHNGVQHKVCCKTKLEAATARLKMEKELDIYKNVV